MKLTMLGTANSAMVPVYGCDCAVCKAARVDPALRREKSSAVVEHNGKRLLIDANAPDLLARFPAGSIDRILLTHYHMDHVQSLFDLRWGMGGTIPVTSPDDPAGCDDLYKHPGILDFSHRAQPFIPFEWEGISITPLPLIHSKLSLGYCFELDGRRLAYLTDTNGLPEETRQWLREHPVQWLITDCNYAPIECPRERAKKNHNDVNQVLDIERSCQPARIGLMHLSHNTLLWAQQNPQALGASIQLLDDDQVIAL